MIPRTGHSKHWGWDRSWWTAVSRSVEMKRTATPPHNSSVWACHRYASVNQSRGVRFGSAPSSLGRCSLPWHTGLRDMMGQQLGELLFKMLTKTKHILLRFTRGFYQNCLGLKWRSLSEEHLPTVHLTLHWTLMDDYDLPSVFVSSKSFIVCVSVGFNSLAPHNIINRPLLRDQPAMALRVRQCQITNGISEDSLLSPLSLHGKSAFIVPYHGCLQAAYCWGNVIEVVQRQKKKIIHVR